MLLKKQTVWLLTMLSLVVVLSVYYVTSEPAVKDIATNGKNAPDTSGKMSDEDMKIITESAGDEAYDAVRISLMDKRGKQQEELTTQAAAPELSIDEKNKLFETMKQIESLGVKERTIESYIKTLGYSDSLVRIEDNQVYVTVKAEEHSKADAVEIVRLVRDEMGTNFIPTVEFDTK
ncbi:SpoIIIAH-like family protein [Lederbergia wuyishanensis]|uniref:Stage III sporulation protein AH n=1 Tax=Lederbergia wuyishanensis TaxID=1347903 RepID=A0ABU0D199_9BACI|nr:SpoIIIAH-like family protein [Lederbergia wuyishanensis]MCJ8006793.1 SpoIIIAH-like family protein [Lederbergia wuyishanensis]MDQ0342175.1 stage III sporulation protein AH [Lederbergia wuyishanensis]